MKTFYANGQLDTLESYRYNQLHGLSQGFAPNGILVREANFLDGLLDGPVREYYKTGQLKKETFYKSDKRDGPEKEYYPNGTLQFERLYENGQLITSQQYSFNNQVAISTH